MTKNTHNYIQSSTRTFVPMSMLE